MSPVVKINAELERGLSGFHELGFADPKNFVEELQRRNRSFTDADRADFF
jgi:hypothetical protein